MTFTIIKKWHNKALHQALRNDTLPDLNVLKVEMRKVGQVYMSFIVLFQIVTISLKTSHSIS